MMKKRHYFLCAVLSLLVLGQAMAQQLSPEQARAKAEAFLQQKTGLRSASDLQLCFAVRDTTQLDAGATLRAASESGDALLYAFRREAGGFVIASGDERTHAVLAYSTEGSLDANHLPDGARDFLRQYAVEIATLQSGELVATSAGEELSYDPAWQPVEPMITARWSQDEPYNLQTPIEEGKRCMTGCSATMFAQLMDYYRYQNWKVAEETWFSGTDLMEGYINREVAVQFTDTVDWSLLRRSYGGKETYTEAEVNEVAKLMKYAGAALHVMYGVDGSGLYPHQALDRLDTVADYGKHAIFKYAWEYPLRTWSEKLYCQLAAGRPVPYNSAGGEHIFLLDGYAGDGMFHFNIGFGGSLDGYYLLTALLPEYRMNLYQSAFFDWCPSYMEPIESHRVLLSGNHIGIARSEQGDFTWKLNLMAFDPQPQSGTLRYTLHASADAEPITSEPFDFAFTPDANYLSDTLQVPFPAYSSLDQPVYEVRFWQKQGDGWEPLPTFDYFHNWQLWLRRNDEGYLIERSLPEIELRFVEPSAQLHVHSVDTLAISWRYTQSDLSIGMTADIIQPVLLRQGKEIELPSDMYLLEMSDNQLQLIVSLPPEVEVGERCQLFAKLHSVSCSDTIDVEVRRGPELVLLERPVLPDTVAVGEELTVSLRVKNIGEVTYIDGTIMFEQDEIPYARVRLFPLPVGVEIEDTMYVYNFDEPGKLQLKLTYEVLNKPHADITVHDLLTVDGEPFTHTFYVVADPTANGQIAASEMTVSWQGRTLCVESAVALKSYHIYNVEGGLVATGPINGASARIDGSAWPTGVYVVAIETEDGKRIIYKVRN